MHCDVALNLRRGEDSCGLAHRVDSGSTIPVVSEDVDALRGDVRVGEEDAGTSRRREISRDEGALDRQCEPGIEISISEQTASSAGRAVG